MKNEPAHLRKVNAWRDQLNPLRGITIQKVAQYLEAGDRGEYADLQWLYRMVEKRDAVTRALIQRRSSALGKLNWDIKQNLEKDSSESSKALADDQARVLRATYNRIGNLNQAIEFIELAEFRGYSHLEKHFDLRGDIIKLNPVDQWFWTRQGIYGDWLYDAKANASRSQGVPIDTNRFVIYEPKAPINEIGVIAFMRKNLSQKDWDAFCEVYGIPATFIIMPPDVPAEKESEYQDMAEATIGNMRGTLPNGADVKNPDAGASNHPFPAHIKYQDEQLVLAGTSGKLTMLSEATGIGGGASDVHQDTFDEVAQSDAAKISETLQRQIDHQVLAVEFPGLPILAYFALAAEDIEDVTALVNNVVALNAAGHRMDTEELAERTGYKLTSVPVTAPTPGAPLFNRADDPADQIAADKRDALAKATADDLAPIRERLDEILAIEDQDFMLNALKNFEKELPELLLKINTDPAAAEVLFEAMDEARMNALKEADQKREAVAS